MSDIVERLRRWAISTDAVSASDLMDEAAGEIERLRSWMRIQDAVIHSGNVAALTEEERVVLGNIANDAAYRALSHTERVVRGLLERLGDKEAAHMSDTNERSVASDGSVAERPLGDPEIAVEILRLRVAELEEAIRRFAEQDALLSVLCKRDGSQVVTVTMDGTLTDAEQSLIRRLAAACEGGHPREWTNRALTADDRATLRGLLERLG